MPKQACGGYVLAGGKSSRMGQNKAFLDMHGVPLVVTAARTVAAVAETVTLVGDPLIYAGLGLPVIADHYPGCGPLAGIHAALHHATHEWNLVAACDMPVARQVWDELLRQLREAFDCVMPVAGGRLEPLGALYHRRCLEAIDEALAAGRYKVTDALAGLRLLRVPFPAETFRNLNTPEEWRDFVSHHV